MSNRKTPMVTDEMIEHQKMLEGYRQGGPRWTAHTVRDAYERLLEANAREEKASDLTVRDYFAAKALQGMMSNKMYGEHLMNALAKTSYVLADAMLKAREE